ncbi:transposase [Streptomyces mirabilis]|uniref:IS110 family transposase n=1 Tax=Streptomyces mirabilis TaxID=68239 RepID=UPI0037A384CE
MLQYCRRDCASTSRARPHGELSRKRPDDPVTWNAGRLRVADVRRWPFGCLTLVLVDAAGSPRKVPQGSRCSWTSCLDPQWRAQAGRRQRDGQQRITPASAGVIRTSPAEDCRQLSRRLEGDLLAVGERIVRVPPQLMAHCHTAACTYGKSDPIDALVAARAALREPDLPTAHLDDASREVRLLMDHRDNLVAERTRVVNRLRWHVHELGPPARSLTQPKQVKRAYARHSRTAPLPVWSGMGYRQLNVALHRIAITQAHFHPEARDHLQRRPQAGDHPTTESIRVLKRWLSDVVHQALRRDAHSAEEPQNRLATAA